MIRARDRRVLYQNRIEFELSGDEVYYAAGSLVVIVKIRVVNFITGKFELNSLFMKVSGRTASLPQPPLTTLSTPQSLASESLIWISR